MENALIGYSGFVGSSLLRQLNFDHRFRSSNIDELCTRAYDRVVCCAAPAQKWLANKEPEADLKNIESLISSLEHLECKQFVLISTVDVFNDPEAIDERSEIHESSLQAYGLHRRLLEKFVESRFANCLVVRLPGLVGPGLRKNIIYDFAHNNEVDKIESRSIFQFYPMVNLSYDIETAITHNLSLVHLTAEPISVSDVAGLAFNRTFDNTLPRAPVAYDMRSVHAELFSGNTHYQYTASDSLMAIRSYAQSLAV